jgi:hypothetical protein
MKAGTREQKLSGTRDNWGLKQADEKHPIGMTCVYMRR